MLKLPNTIKMVITDFDGILTDNYVYISDSCQSTRRINYKDVTGCFLLKHAGIDISIISGEKNPAIEWLKETFELKEVHQRIREKLPVLKSIIKRYNLKEDEYIYIGDDINDISAMELVDYRIAPKNYNPIMQFKVQNLQITEAYGGFGVIREIADILVK